MARHSGPVTGLSFNPHKSSSHLLGSGGADSEVFIMALDRPDTPTVFVPGPKPNTVRHECIRSLSHTLDRKEAEEGELALATPGAAVGWVAGAPYPGRQRAIVSGYFCGVRWW